MFKIHAVQAQFGDCLIVEFGSAGQQRFVLVDGGPNHTFEKSLAGALSDIVTSSKLDLVILSHIDNDHIVGLLDLFAALEEDQANEDKPRIRAGGLWHNSFQKSIDPTGEISQRLQLIMAMAGSSRVAMPFAADAFFGVKEGNRLRILAKKLKVPINKGFADDLILVETSQNEIRMGNLKIKVVGPNQANLDALHNKWLKWLATTEKHLGDPEALANADRSVPNLSSLVLVLECDKKTMLLTGDARSDHILSGLEMSGLLNGGQMHVDLLKVPHHGSNQNVTAGFFKEITADKYVISADGTNGNPDYDTLKWIVEAAHAVSRPIEIVVTNLTPSMEDLKASHDPKIFGYRLRIKPKARKSIEASLA